MEQHVRALIDVVDRQAAEIKALRELLTPNHARMQELREQTVRLHYSKARLHLLLDGNDLLDIPGVFEMAPILDRPGN